MHYKIFNVFEISFKGPFKKHLFSARKNQFLNVSINLFLFLNELFNWKIESLHEIKMNKLIIFSAPSGAGKTTIVQHLLKVRNDLMFSVSACSRAKRTNEIDGKDYYFLTLQDFKQKIKEEAFVEWEEVYENNFYGTLKTEIQRIFELGKAVVFDVDVVGGLNLKKQFGDQALAIFVKPPSKEILYERLKARKTESAEKIAYRIAKAEKELEFENKFDLILLNDDLNKALKDAEKIVADFL